jgi:hypothetical protein
MTAVLTESRRIDVSGTPDTAQPMPRTANTLGICATCSYVDACTSRVTWMGPVFHCEEFDDRVEVPQYEPAPQDRIEETHAAISARPSAGRPGLCVNCAHEKACGLQRQEGGVWHCEEYE